MRCAMTGTAISRTSSGMTNSRPSESASACPAFISASEARGLAPSWIPVAARVARTTSTAYRLSSSLMRTPAARRRRVGRRRRAVALAGQQHVGEAGALVKVKGVVALVEHGPPEDARRQEIGGEREALEAPADGSRERLRQGGLAGAGVVLEQHM